MDELTRRAFMDVTPDHLARALMLPIGVRVTGAEWDQLRDVAVLYLAGSALPYQTPEGCTAPKVSLHIESRLT